MKEQETVGEGVVYPQQSPGKPPAAQRTQRVRGAASRGHVSSQPGPESDVVAELLRDRLATKLTEDELTSLIDEVAVLCTAGAKETASHSAPETQPPSQSEEDRVSRLKSSVDYIEYKFREIERALRATDRHVRPRDRDRRERVFRDRSPIEGLSDGLMYTLTSTRVGPAIIRSRNPCLDSYFS